MEIITEKDKIINKKKKIYMIKYIINVLLTVTKILKTTKKKPPIYKFCILNYFYNL